MHRASFADEGLFMWEQRGYGPIWLEPAKYIRIWIQAHTEVLAQHLGCFRKDC